MGKLGVFRLRPCYVINIVRKTKVTQSIYIAYIRLLTLSRVAVAAIKTGRYTHAKKAKDITEVKLLLAQQQHHHGQQQPQTQSSSTQSSNQPSEQSMDTDNVSSAAAATAANDANMSPKLSPLSAADASPSSSLSSSSPLASHDLEKIIDHITSVYVSQTPLNEEFIAALPDREKRYLVRTYCLLP